jgi:acyl carrier protein
MQPVGEFVPAAIADACNVERSAVSGSTRLVDLGFDSLSVASLTYQIESAYGVELTQEDVIRLYEALTVDEARDYVARLVGSQQVAVVRAG